MLFLFHYLLGQLGDVFCKLEMGFVLEKIIVGLFL